MQCRTSPARHRMIWLISDGEPSDIDQRDPLYLRADTRAAVSQLRRRGVQTCCVTLDRKADSYVEWLFGVGHFLIIDHIDRLPEFLSSFYLRLV